MKPILFNTDMVRTILDNRKTVTRRVVKPQPEARLVPGEKDCYIYRGIPCGLDGMTNFAPYRPGDILYVRETWAAWSRTMGTPPALYYKADRNNPDGIKWRSSIHMPREAARIFLRVTDVRMEKLQSMRTQDSLKEGVPLSLDGIMSGRPTLEPFARIWDSTIKPADRDLYGWDANPWCWIIEFERCGKPEGA